MTYTSLYRLAILLFIQGSLGQLQYVSRMHLAAKEGWPPERVKEYIKAGADLERQDFELNRPLHIAAEEKNLELLKLFVQAGVGLDYKNNEGQTALHIAAAKGDTRAVQVLLSNGAKPNLRDDRGQTPLMLASENGRFSTVKVLLQGGADATLKDSTGRGGESAAMKAAAEGFTRIAKILEGGQ